MEIYYPTLEERLHKERLDFFAKIKQHRDWQKMIDFVESNEWLIRQEKASVYCHMGTYLIQSLVIHISNVVIEDFIENVLGPFHLKFNILWEMTIDGSEKDPIFIFSEKDKYDWLSTNMKFKVKEGEFKKCKVVKKVVSFSKPIEPMPVYNLEMICE